MRVHIAYMHIARMAHGAGGRGGAVGQRPLHAPCTIILRVGRVDVRVYVYVRVQVCAQETSVVGLRVAWTPRLQISSLCLRKAAAPRAIHW